MNWFEKLVGFEEKNPNQVRNNLEVRKDKLISKVNGKVYTCGILETPTLGALRESLEATSVERGELKIREVVGNIQDIHQNPLNAGALFQAASQFNLLEMVNQKVTPEEGVGIYEYDKTQGPACAISAGAGTIYRNYFAEVNGQVGQSAENQIDCLADIGDLLGNDAHRLWKMQNGYALATADGLVEIDERIRIMNEEEKDKLRQKLRIGLQWNTQVTLGGNNHLLTQAYCSALPVAYSHHPIALWESFARLVLEASYEAVFSAATINAAHTANEKVYLTLIGGGVFGNEEEWIFDAIRRSLKLFNDYPLDIVIVSYGRSKKSVQDFIESWVG